MLTGNIFETTGMPNCAGTATVTRLEIERMGLWVADLLSDQQLAAAAERYNAKVALNKQHPARTSTCHSVARCDTVAI